LADESPFLSVEAAAAVLAIIFYIFPPPNNAIMPPCLTGDFPVCPVITEAESLY
jgi:hypothetical protein